MTEPNYCLGCYDEATHDTTGRGDANEPTCGKCCNQCGETGCDAPIEDDNEL